LQIARQVGSQVKRDVGPILAHYECDFAPSMAQKNKIVPLTEILLLVYLIIMNT
jgi:hypothetical protein